MADDNDLGTPSLPSADADLERPSGSVNDDDTGSSPEEFDDGNAADEQLFEAFTDADDEPSDDSTDDEADADGEDSTDETEAPESDSDDGETPTEAGTDESEEGAEDSENSEEDETPKKGDDARLDKHPRFKQLIKERNELRDEARQLRHDAKQIAELRKAAEERGWKDGALEQWIEMGLYYKDSPGSYTDIITLMAESVGLEVRPKVPPGLKEAYEKGEIGEDYYNRELQRHQQEALKPAPPPEGQPRFSLRPHEYTAEDAQAEVNEIAQRYIEEHSGIFTSAVMQEAQKEIEQEFANLKARTGYDPAPDRWGVITGEVLERVKERHRQPIKKPSHEPVRRSQAPQNRRRNPAAITSTKDLADDPDLKRVFGWQ